MEEASAQEARARQLQKNVSLGKQTSQEPKKHKRIRVLGLGFRVKNFA